MNENKNLVKCALGFLLAILVIVGGIFGLDVNVRVNDTSTDAPTMEEPVASDVPVDETVVESTENEDAVDTDKVVDDTTDEVVDPEHPSGDSAPSEEEQPSVDEPVVDEVTDPTDENEETVTE